CGGGCVPPASTPASTSRRTRGARTAPPRPRPRGRSRARRGRCGRRAPGRRGRRAWPGEDSGRELLGDEGPGAVVGAAVDDGGEVRGVDGRRLQRPVGEQRGGGLVPRTR